MKNWLGIAVLGVALLAACGDEVVDDRRTVTIERNGNSGDANADGGGDANGGSNAGDTGSSDNGGSDINNPPGTSLVGAIVSISPMGVVEGWAVDRDATDKSISLTFFVDGDQDSGTEVGSVSADQTGFDNNFDGDHRFSFQLPAEHRTGAEKELNIYMDDGEQEGPISAQARLYIAYAPTQDGMDYYQNTLRPLLARAPGQGGCASGNCHNAGSEVTYDNHYSLLIDKAPSQGGTATNNKLIINPAAVDQHGGGNRCGGINNGICAQIQTWWGLEFN